MKFIGHLDIMRYFQKAMRALRRASAGRTVLSVSHRIYENLGGRAVKIEPQSM